MIAKISLTAAFFLMVAPPMACALNRDAANPAPITRQAHELPPGMVVAQDDQSNADASDNGNDNDNGNGNDSDSNDSADGNQNADGNQMDQQNADGNDQPIAPQALDAPGNPGDAQQAPQNPFSSVAPTDR